MHYVYDAYLHIMTVEGVFAVNIESVECGDGDHVLCDCFEG